MIKIKYTKSYDNCLKKLKKYPDVKDNILSIISFVKNVEFTSELMNNPIARMYGFERLKYQNNEFYSFNPNKKGVIRLILTIDIDNNIIYLVYISFDHYKDFSKDKVIYYDE